MNSLGILYSVGPGLGILLSSYVVRVFSRVFAAPIFIARTFWSILTFIGGAIFSVLEKCVPWFTGWLQSTFPTSERINQGIDNLITKTIKFFQGQNFFIRFLFELTLRSIKFLLDVILAVYKAIPHIFFALFLVYIWFFIGYPLMYVAATPQAAADNLNVYFEGVESLVKLFTVVFNLFALVANVINPFFQNTLSFFAKIIALATRDLLQGVTFENTASAGGGSRNTRETMRKLSSQFTPNSPEFTSATSDLNNAWTQDNEGWEISERSFLFLESSAVQASYAATSILLIIIELFIAIVYPIIGAIVDAIAGGGQTGLCCSVTDGGGWAIGYCAARFGVSLLQSVIKAIGLSTPSIVASINELLPKNPPPEIPCRCSGILKPVPPCRPPLYYCPAVRTEAGIPYYQEVVSRYKSVATQSETEVGAINPQKSIACPNYLRQEQRKTRNRGLLESSTTCETTCYKVPGKGSWLVYWCEGEKGDVEYKGPCPGEESGPIDFKKEVIKLLQTKPDFLSPAQRQMLLHKHTSTSTTTQEAHKDEKITATTGTPPPTIFFQSIHPEEEEEELQTPPLEGLSAEKVKEAIQQLEKIQIQGCPNTFKDSFEDFLLRLFCLVLRFSKLSPEAQQDTTTGIPWVSKFPRHLAYVSNMTELVEYHASWYKAQTGGKRESIVPSVNETLTVIVTNAAKQLYQHKKKVVLKDKAKARGRKLQDPSASDVNPGSNPLTSETPLCPYKCPAGECVARDNIAACTLPTNWTLAATTRYIAYSVTATTENFDGQFLLESVVACWAGYIENPSIDPFTYRGFIEYVSGNDMSGYVYCFPSFQHIPYLPDVTFKFTTFVTQLCAPNQQLNGPSAISECFCSQYNNIDIFNYAAWSTVFTPAFVTARAFNAWKVLQWLLVGWNIGFTGNFWTFFAMWANPQQSPEILYAFNQNFAAGGRTPTKNWLCAAVHSGELAFFLILLYILWIIAGYLGLLIFHYILDLLKLFFVSFIHRGLTWLTVYLYTQRVKKNSDEILIKLKVPKPGNKGEPATPVESTSYGKNIEV